MHRESWLGLASFVSLSLLPSSALALGFRIPNQDAEAIGRGNAFVATANNPSALYYNPAGITQLKGTHVQFGAHIISVNSDYTSPTGARARTKREVQPVPQFYATQSLNDRFTVGVGIYAPFGLGLEWPETTGFRTLAEEGRLMYSTVKPVLAWKINDKLSLAAGPTLNYAKVMLRQGVLAPGDEFKFKGDGYAVGAGVGVLWQPHSKWSFGANYQSATTVEFDGTSYNNFAFPLPAQQATRATLPFPQFVMAGISFRPNDKWNLEVGADWTDWDTLNTVTFERSVLPINFALNWKSSFLYHAGFTRQLPKGWFVSAGYFFSENSTTERDFNPIVPDTDLHVASLGTGRKLEKWTWAVTAQLITGPARTVNSSVSPSFIGESANGKYHFFNQALNFSVAYHF